MTKQELLDRLEIIKDSLSDTKNITGIEGTLTDIEDLMWQINIGMD